MTEFDDLPNPDEEELPKSKSQIKREMEALQQLGASLVELGDGQLALLPLDDKLRKAIADARGMKQREGRRRQLQFIGKLMRKADHQAIEEGYRRLTEMDRQSVQRHHQVERWRDRILAEGAAALNDFFNDFPQADRQHVRQLLRAAQKEQAHDKPPAQARKLFRYIRELIEADT